MKTKQNISQLIWAIIILALGTCIVQASEAPAIQWNETAQSHVMNNNELVKLGGAFPSWKIKQTTWPSVTELSSKKVAIDKKLNVSCIGWLGKFMKKKQLPTNLDKHLIAMKDWGLIRKESEQKRLCDVFIARFKKTPYVIHIQESPYNVVIAIADERLAKDARADHKNFVVEMAMLIFNEALKPNPNSEDFHIHEIVREGGKITKISWLLESVATTDKSGKKCIDLVKAWEKGAKRVKAETDGRFVRFEIVKCVKGPRNAPDPYIERFTPSK